MSAVSFIPAEALPYAKTAAAVTGVFVLVLWRLHQLRRVEARLIEDQKRLQAQVVRMQNVILAVKQDGAGWRTDMQRLLDGARASISRQINAMEQLAAISEEAAQAEPSTVLTPPAAPTAHAPVLPTPEVMEPMPA